MYKVPTETEVIYQGYTNWIIGMVILFKKSPPEKLKISIFKRNKNKLYFIGQGHIWWCNG